MKPKLVQYFKAAMDLVGRTGDRAGRRGSS